jgi:hypothetical protein
MDIVARLPSNATEQLASAVLKAGQSSMSVELPPAKAEGFVYIWAKQPELKLGGAYLRVKPQGAQRAPSTPGQIRPEARKMAAFRAMPIAKLAAVAPAPSTTAAAVAAPAPVQPAPPPAQSAAPPASDASYMMALRYSPQRAFLADRKDPVTVHAFVMATRDAPLPGFRIELFDSSGTLAPAPLVIPPGAEEGTATLTSDHEGPVKIEYLGSTPRVALDGDKIMTVNFEPPITGFELRPSPPRISLVDTCDLLVSLVDDKGTPIATNARRTISLALSAGRGDFSARDVSVDPGNSSARATFTPVWWGPVAITASTPNLVSVEAQLTVAPPLGLLGFSLAGGLLGGYVFMLNKRSGTKRWRVPLGALTGVILLWACLFLGLGALPRAAILNPISVFVISVVGGWLGTGVFEPILKLLGLSAASS